MVSPCFAPILRTTKRAALSTDAGCRHLHIVCHPGKYALGSTHTYSVLLLRGRPTRPTITTIALRRQCSRAEPAGTVCAAVASALVAAPDKGDAGRPWYHITMSPGVCKGQPFVGLPPPPPPGVCRVLSFHRSLHGNLYEFHISTPYLPFRSSLLCSVQCAGAVQPFILNKNKTAKRFSVNGLGPGYYLLFNAVDNIPHAGT